MIRILAALAAAAITLPAASWAQQQQQPAPAATAKPAAAKPATVKSTAQKPKTFNITSKNVRDGGKLAEHFGGMNPQNKNCTGKNISPALRWSNPPEGTKSYAIMMLDPVGRAPLGVVHWLAYDIPAKKMSLAEGEASKPSTEFKGGKNLPGQEVYFGPCPPFGDKAHPYVIVLMATDIEPGTMKAGMNREELAAALQNHVKGQTSLVARYGH